MGERVGHFVLKERLGAGGFGEVYRAVHLGQPWLEVAIKLIRPDLAHDPRRVSALERECRLLSQLNHPNIVRFRDVFLHQGRPALVMDLLEGQDLRALFSNRTFRPSEVIRIVAQVLDALAHAHRHNIVHRDIKPANLFLSGADGELRVIVTDFGIGRAAGDGEKTGRLVGSLGYMAPERFHGVVSPRGDLYALGLIGWELLAGRRACPPGALPERMAWHCTQGPPPLAEAAPHAPAWFRAFLHRLLSSDPRHRPANAAAAQELMNTLRVPTAKDADTDTTSLPADLGEETIAVSSPQASLDTWRFVVGTSPATLAQTCAALGLAAGVGAGLVSVGVGRELSQIASMTCALWLVWPMRETLGGGGWALVWLAECGVGCALLSDWGEAVPWSGMAIALLGAASWGAAMWWRLIDRWPTSVLEIWAYFLGLGGLCVLFWKSCFGMV